MGGRKMIALASDHGGYELKQKVIGYLEANGYTCHDFGCYSLESCDYPEFGRAAAEAVAKGECETVSYTHLLAPATASNH